MNEYELKQIGKFVDFLNEHREKREQDMYKEKNFYMKLVYEAKLDEIEFIHNIFDLIVLGKKESAYKNV